MSTKHRPGYMPWDRTGNRILVQSSLGRNKPTNYEIREQTFAYGKSTNHDPEKANEMMYHWNKHQNSQNSNVGKIKDLLATNRAALKQMATTAPGNYEFRKTNTIYKSMVQGTNHIKIKLPDETFTYGKPGQLEDPIKLVIANNYGQTDKNFRHTMYQSQMSYEPKRKLSCHITKNHHLLKEATAKRMALFDWTRRNSQREPWKITKFSQVQRKVDTNIRPFSSINPRSTSKPDTAKDQQNQIKREL